MVRTVLILAAGIFTASSQALTCEPLYRFAYSEYSKRGNPALREAASLYLMHFDASNGIAEVYAEARPLFAALNVAPAQEDRVLETLSEKIKSGELCPNGKTVSLAAAAEILRPSLKN